MTAVVFIDFLLTFTASDLYYVITQIDSPLCALFQKFFSFNFHTLIMMCLDMALFGFFLFGVGSASWI